MFSIWTMTWSFARLYSRTAKLFLNQLLSHKFPLWQLKLVLVCVRMAVLHVSLGPLFTVWARNLLWMLSVVFPHQPVDGSYCEFCTVSSAWCFVSPPQHASQSSEEASTCLEKAAGAVCQHRGKILWRGSRAGAKVCCPLSATFWEGEVNFLREIWIRVCSNFSNSICLFITRVSTCCYLELEALALYSCSYYIIQKTHLCFSLHWWTLKFVSLLQSENTETRS